jgi:hypothetical protein
MSYTAVVAAPGAGGRPEPQLLPHLQQALHVRGAAHGAHEVRPQGPQRFRSSRFGFLNKIVIFLFEFGIASQAAGLQVKKLPLNHKERLIPSVHSRFLYRMFNFYLVLHLYVGRKQGLPGKPLN